MWQLLVMGFIRFNMVKIVTLLAFVTFGIENFGNSSSFGTDSTIEQQFFVLHWFICTNFMSCPGIVLWIRGIVLQMSYVQIHQQYLLVSSLQAEEDAAVKLCIQHLRLRSLSKEPSVNFNQMISCCKRLVEECNPLMQGLHICVSHFYSVMQDGILCIPWDWKNWAGRIICQPAGC